MNNKKYRIWINLISLALIAVFLCPPDLCYALGVRGCSTYFSNSESSIDEWTIIAIGIIKGLLRNRLAPDRIKSMFNMRINSMLEKYGVSEEIHFAIEITRETQDRYDITLNINGRDVSLVYKNGEITLTDEELLSKNSPDKIIERISGYADRAVDNEVFAEYLILLLELSCQLCNEDLDKKLNILLARLKEKGHPETGILSQAVKGRLTRAASCREIEELLEAGRALVFTKDANSMDAILSAYAESAGKRYLRINLKDIDEYNKLILEVNVAPSGDYKVNKGRLIELIEEGGILFIDYNDAQPQLVEGLNSLFDSVPYFTSRWGRHPVSPNFRIIGALDDSQIGLYPTSFYSRYREITDKDWKYDNPLKVESAGEDATGIVAELFESPMYKEELIGSYYLREDGGIGVKKGKIIESIEQNKPLIISGGLWDDEMFGQFLNQILISGGVRFNGRFYILPKNFKIMRRDRDYAKGIEKKSIVYKSSRYKDAPVWIINQSTQDVLFSRIRIDNEKGYVAQLDGVLGGTGTVRLRITGYLKDWVWHKIMHSEPEIEIEVDPGVAIPPIYRKHLDKSALSEKAPSMIKDWADIGDEKVILAEGPDRGLILEKITERYENPIIYHVTPNTTMSDIMSSMEMREGRKFYSETKDVLNALREGRVVVLEGLSRNEDLMGYFATALCDEPYLMVNGERVNLKELAGRLIILGPLDNFPYAPLRTRIEVDDEEVKRILQKEFNAEDRVVLSDEDYQEILSLKRIFETIPHPRYIRKRLEELGIRHAIPMAYEPDEEEKLYPHKADLGLNRLRRLCMYRKSLGREDKSSWLKAFNDIVIEEYADVPFVASFMRVMVRLRFKIKDDLGRQINGKALSSLVNQVVYPAGLESRFWQLADTMSYELLDSSGIPQEPCPDPGKMQLPLNQIKYALIGNADAQRKEFYKELFGIRNTPEDYARINGDLEGEETWSQRETRCVNLLRIMPAVFLRGPPGVGKSFICPILADRLGLKMYGPVSAGADISEGDIIIQRKYDREKGQVLYDEKIIAEWAKNLNGGLLVVDEANLTNPYFWNFLSGIFNSKPYIWLNGKRYELTSKHRVVFTGNQEKAVGRQYQDLFKEYVVTVNFPDFDKEFINERLHEYLDPDKKELKGLVFEIFGIFKKMGEGRSFSLRDLQEICYRLNLLNRDEIDTKAILAVFWEVLKGLFSIEEQIALQHIISKKYGLDILAIEKESIGTETEAIDVEEIGHKLVFTKSARDFRNIVKRFLFVREKRIGSLTSPLHGKRGLVFEGPSGRGKDLFVINILENSGYSEGKPEGETKGKPKEEKNKKIYYRISATINYDDMVSVIDKARQEGAIVIISEINLIPSAVLEGKLNSALTGSAEQGFAFIGTINSTNFSGREKFSTALQNRMLYYRIYDYTQDELREIVACQGALSTMEGEGDYLVNFHCWLRSNIKNKAQRPTIREIFKVIELMQKGKSLDDAINKVYGPVYLKILRLGGIPMPEREIVQNFKEPNEADNKVVLQKIAQFILPEKGTKPALAWDADTKHGGYYQSEPNLIGLNAKNDLEYNLRTIDHESGHGLFTRSELFPYLRPTEDWRHLYMWLEDMRMENAMRYHFPYINLVNGGEIVFINEVKNRNLGSIRKTMKPRSIFLYILSAYARGFITREDVIGCADLWQKMFGLRRKNPFKMAEKHLDTARNIIGVDPSVRSKIPELTGEIGMIPESLDETEIRYKSYCALKLMREIKDDYLQIPEEHEEDTVSDEETKKGQIEEAAKKLAVADLSKLPEHIEHDLDVVPEKVGLEKKSESVVRALTRGIAEGVLRAIKFLYELPRILFWRLFDTIAELFSRGYRKYLMKLDMLLQRLFEMLHLGRRYVVLVPATHSDSQKYNPIDMQIGPGITPLPLSVPLAEEEEDGNPILGKISSENDAVLRRLLKQYFYHKLSIGKVRGPDGSSLDVEKFVADDPPNSFIKSGASEKDMPKEIILVGQVMPSEWNPVIEEVFMYLFGLGFTVTVYTHENQYVEGIKTLSDLKMILGGRSNCDIDLINRHLEETLPRRSYIVTGLKQIQRCVEAEYLYHALVMDEADFEGRGERKPGVVHPHGPEPLVKPGAGKQSEIPLAERERQRDVILNLIHSRGILKGTCIVLEGGFFSLDLIGGVRREDISLLQGLTNLKKLKLWNFAQIEDLSLLSGLTNLEELELWNCTQIKDLKPLSGLTNLKRLDIDGCTQIEDLSPLSRLTNLEQLKLSGCAKIKHLKPLSRLTNLEWLDLGGCTQIKRLKPLSRLTNLEWLDIGGCTQIKHLEPLSGLTNLKKLSLNGCTQIKDLNLLSRLTNLEELSLENCNQIEDLSPLSRLNNLKKLSLDGCTQIEDLSPLSGLSNLRVLSLKNCNQIEDLSPLSGLTNLEELSLENCAQIKHLKSLSRLINLKNLYLENCKQIEDLSPLSRLTNLRILRLDGCAQIKYSEILEILIGLPNLEGLTLRHTSITNEQIYGLFRDSPNRENLTVINKDDEDIRYANVPPEYKPQTPKIEISAEERERQKDVILRFLDSNSVPKDRFSESDGFFSLDLTGTQIEDLNPLSGLTNLKKLTLFRCTQIKDISPLSGLINLESLHINDCYNIKDLNPLSGLTNLKELNLDVYAQEDLNPLSRLTNLESLNLSILFHIEDIGLLSGLTNLKKLVLYSYQPYNDKLKDLSPLRGLTNLESLSLFNWSYIEDISPLSELSNLKSLSLNACSQIKDISPLRGLTNLERLGLDGCIRIEDLNPLSGLTNLKELILNSCTGIKNLSPLRGLSNLEKLHLRDCIQIDDISPLSKLPNLKVIYLSDTLITDKQIYELFRDNPNCENLTVINKDHEQKRYADVPKKYKTPTSKSVIPPKERRRQRQDILRFLKDNRIKKSRLKVLDNGFFSLDLMDTQIEDLSPLSGLTNLEEIWLAGTKIRSLSPLSGLPNLERVYLDYEQFRKLGKQIDELFRDNPNGENLKILYYHEEKGRAYEIVYTDRIKKGPGAPAPSKISRKKDLLSRIVKSLAAPEETLEKVRLRLTAEGKGELFGLIQTLLPARPANAPIAPYVSEDSSAYFGMARHRSSNRQIRRIFEDENKYRFIDLGRVNEIIEAYLDSTGRDLLDGLDLRWKGKGGSEEGVTGNLNIGGQDITRIIEAYAEIVKYYIELYRSNPIDENRQKLLALLEYDISVLDGVNFSGHYGKSRRRVYLPLEMLEIEAVAGQSPQTANMLEDFIEHEYLESRGMEHNSVVALLEEKRGKGFNRRMQVLYREYVINKLLAEVGIREGAEDLRAELSRLLHMVQKGEELTLQSINTNGLFSAITRNGVDELSIKVARLINLLLETDYRGSKGIVMALALSKILAHREESHPKKAKVDQGSALFCELKERQIETVSDFCATIKNDRIQQKPRKTILALDMDICDMQKYATGLLSELSNGDADRLGNVYFVRGNGNGLQGKIKDKIQSLISKGDLDSEDNIDIVIVAKDANIKKGSLNDFANRKNTYIAGIDDAKIQEGSYIPILEMLTFALEIVYGDDFQYINELYRDITDEGLTMDEYERIKGQIISESKFSISLILPAVTPLDINELKEIYETTKLLLKSA